MFPNETSAATTLATEIILRSSEEEWALKRYLSVEALEAVENPNPQYSRRRQEDLDSFVEEVVVRCELSMNFCHFTPHYGSFSCLPDWAKKTLGEHKGDERAHAYTTRQLESAKTHDPYWNAAMRKMVHTGHIHNHMRMYWGKKILEWTNTPKHAYKTTLYLNNRYFLDGRDPNSYANVSPTPATTTAAGRSARSRARSATCQRAA